MQHHLLFFSPAHQTPQAKAKLQCYMEVGEGLLYLKSHVCRPVYCVAGEGHVCFP